jgi:hypothetical protein
MSSSALRQLREDDAEAVASLFVECFGDARLVDPEEICSWLRNAELEPDWLRVLDEGGHVAGYGDIWPQGGELTLDAAAPGRWDVFFDWAEEEAGRRCIPLFAPRCRTATSWRAWSRRAATCRGVTR